MMNKKGLSMIELFVYAFVFLIVVLLLGIFLIIYGYINFGLDRDIDVGQVNLQSVNNQTFGRINTAFQDNADTIGIVMIFGMVLSMFITAYFTGRNYPKIMLVVDILILVFVFILAVYISQTYNTLITSNTGGVLDPFVDNLPKGSKFILNLPIYISIIGIIMIIITYGVSRKSEQVSDVNEVSTLGYD